MFIFSVTDKTQRDLQEQLCPTDMLYRAKSYVSYLMKAPD